VGWGVIVAGTGGAIVRVAGGVRGMVESVQPTLNSVRPKDRIVDLFMQCCESYAMSLRFTIGKVPMAGGPLG
jgi:hypothetical protein